jgi:hypothetical protein
MEFRKLTVISPARHPRPGSDRIDDENERARFMRRAQKLVLAEPKTKALLARRVVDWALSEFGGYVALLSSQEILDAAREGIRRKLNERELEIETATIEAAGVEFINSDEPDVKLKKRPRP